MFFTKFPHRANFTPASAADAGTGTVRVGSRTLGFELASYEDDIAVLRISNPELWPANRSLAPLELPAPSERARVKVDDAFRITLKGKNGRILLRSREGEPFGLLGEQSLFQFEVGEDTRFYGMGEKTFGRLELSGIRTKFWNTDVWADFHDAQWKDHPTDPPYASVPYIILRTQGEWIGILQHNPHVTFFETPGFDASRAFKEWSENARTLQVGAEGGEPNLVFLYAKTLAELTRKFQRLVGGVPLPPAWSLGYHQSRWGYMGRDDLLRIDAEFTRHQIPCDGLWMDLDYLDGYRIFTTAESAFPGGAKVTTDELMEKSGRRIVPIIDPGVKREPGYAVYDDGHAQDIFCKNPEGTEFVGIVWPGETVFPDLSTQKGRDWFARKSKAFREEGFGGTWVDMNDPSTGPVDPTAMLFRDGTEPHAAHRNQYALGMQMAVHEGFLAAEPNERPFILSRSASTGSGRFAAVWTGDNVSNEFYLRISVPTSLGMSLSGLPFNGPDLGGFGENCSAELMAEWVKAGFLFPFCRNHANRASTPQEPFAFPVKTMSLIRRYIRLRYKLFPYLYGLFADLEASGAPVMRPLMYEFDEPTLDEVNDQFMIGPAWMQAPFLDLSSKTREVVLPGNDPWYDARSGRWVAPGALTVKRSFEETPTFVRAGALVPMLAGTPKDQSRDLSAPHVHVFVPADWSGESQLDLIADDGLTFGYREGERTVVRVTLVAVEGNVAIKTETLQSGFGEIRPVFVFHEGARSVRVDGVALQPAPARVTLTGRPLAVRI